MSKKGSIIVTCGRIGVNTCTLRSPSTLDTIVSVCGVRVQQVVPPFIPMSISYSETGRAASGVEVEARAVHGAAWRVNGGAWCVQLASSTCWFCRPDLIE